MPRMEFQSAEIMQDGRILRVTFAQASGSNPSVPTGPRNSLTLGGVSVEHIGTYVTEENGGVKWLAHFLCPDITVYGATAATVSGQAGALADSEGFTTVAFADQAVANRSQVDDDGFTTKSWARGPGAPTLYVSPSIGDDSRPGLDPEQPLRTIAKAWAIARAAPPGAAIRLRRGEIHVGEGFDAINGLDAARPFILEDYGTSPERAVLKSVTTVALNFARLPFHDVVVRRIEVRPPNPGGEGGIRVANSPTNYVLDDCLIRECNGNTGIQGNDAAPGSWAFINRCILIDAQTTGGGHSQGFYGQSIRNLLISQCTFDHNGWAHGHTEQRDIFKHNIYLNANLKGPVIWGNVICRASSHGMQARGGGIVAYNYFGANAIAGFIGTGGGSMYKNVCEKADDINPQFPRAQAFSTNSSNAALIHGNVVVNSLPGSPYPAAFSMDGISPPAADLRITANTFVDAGSVNLSQVTGKVTFQGNVLANRSVTALNVYPTPASWGWLAAARNKYGLATTRMFNWYATSGDFAKWKTTSGVDADSEAGSVEVEDPTFTLSDSARDAFRDRPRGVWGSQYNVQAIYRDFRMAFTPVQAQ